MDSKMMKTIGQRLNAALAEKDVKQKELAKYLAVTDNTVSYWCSGKRTPNTEQIIKISNRLDVSTDYLLGLSEPKTRDDDLKFVCEYTGLSEDAVGVLSAAKKGSQYFNDFISCLVSLANTSRILIQLDNLSAETSILVQMYSFVGINSLEKMETLWDDTEEIEMGINGMKYVISRFLGNVIDEYSVSYTGLKDYAEFVNLKKGFSDDLLGRMTALYRKEEGGADEEH